MPKPSKPRPRRKITSGDAVERSGGRRAVLSAAVKKLERRNAARVTGIDTTRTRGRGRLARDTKN